MRAPLTIALLLGVTAAVSAQTVYYAISSGENYAQKTWRSSPLATFKAAPPEGVYDSYTVESRNDGTVVVQRDYSTPSGDWLLGLTYEYSRDRRLHKIRSEFVTFGGVSVPDGGGGLTRCIRTFSVSRAGTLRKISERITDAKTGKEVDWQFFEPQVEHWMTLDQLPIPPKT